MGAQGKLSIKGASAFYHKQSGCPLGIGSRHLVALCCGAQKCSHGAAALSAKEHGLPVMLLALLAMHRAPSKLEKVLSSCVGAVHMLVLQSCEKVRNGKSKHLNVSCCAMRTGLNPYGIPYSASLKTFSLMPSFSACTPSSPKKTHVASALPCA